MSLSLFQSECPGTFGIVSRTVSGAECASIASDYELARSHGGNAEPATKREQAVSFNPRLGRIVSILIQDGGVRDVGAIRVALYGSTTCSEEELASFVPPDLRGAVLEVRRVPPASVMAHAIQLAWALDDVRHLHMSDLPIAERAEFLRTRIDPSLLNEVPDLLENLAMKVRHALTLQERRVLFDEAEQGGESSNDSSPMSDKASVKGR